MNFIQRSEDWFSMLTSSLTVLRTCAASLAIAAAGMHPLSAKYNAETPEPGHKELINYTNKVWAPVGLVWMPIAERHGRPAPQR